MKCYNTSGYDLNPSSVFINLPEKEMMMKWEPLFAHLLKLFIRTDKLKPEENNTKPSATDNGEAYKTAKDDEE